MVLKRKAHTKSRTGCAACKKRRIKCNEEKPRCSHCVRHEVSCVYPESVPVRASSSTRHLSPTPHSTPQSAVQIRSPHNDPFASTIPSSGASFSPSFSLKDMALLHHWTTTTSRTILNSPKIDYLFYSVFPRLAYDHDYMMHALISLAALHIAYLHPDERKANLHIAAHHHTLTLKGFRNDINSIGPENGEALFGTASLIFMYSFSTFSKLSDHLEQNDLAGRTSRILGEEWIPLTLGCRTVIGPVYEHITCGPLQQVVHLKEWDDLDPDVQPSSDDAYMLCIKETWQNEENREIYDETLYLLRKTSAWVAHFKSLDGEAREEWGYNRDWSAPFVWVNLVPKEYFTLQRQRQPIALLIFAYFGALLQQLDRNWWTDGCGKSIVSAVDDCLGSYWSDWIEWPKRVVGLTVEDTKMTIS